MEIVKANVLLALLIGEAVLCMWNLHVYIAELSESWLIIDYYLWGSIFTWGPLLYFYILAIATQFKLDSSLIIKHFGLAVFLIVFQLPLHVLISYEAVKITQVMALGNILLVSFYIHMAIYFYAGFKVLYQYDRKIKNNYSQIDTIRLSWLNRLVIVLAAFIVIDMVLSLSAMVRGDVSSYALLYMMGEAITVFIIGYFSLLHSSALFPAVAVEELRPLSSPRLDENIISDLSTKLEAVMQDSSPYRKNDLRLSELADMLDVSRQMLSQFINQHYDKNFYEFINEYRVHSAAQELASNRKANIEKVAFDAGFNNRVSFHNAFKKIMGKTPSQYRSDQ